MIIVKHKKTGLYLGGGSGIYQTRVPKHKARVFQTESGAKRSITFGLLKENAHLLDQYEIIEIKISSGETL